MASGAGALVRTMVVACAAIQLAAGCTRFSPAPSLAAPGDATAATEATEATVQAPPAIRGRVDWPGSAQAAGYGVQTTPAQVINGATVSLIDQTTGNTIATGLTDSAGRFTIDPAFKAAPDTGYFLEAVKGINGNTPGWSAFRLRTVLMFEQGGWTSMTGPAISISAGTTALSIISVLRGVPTSTGITYPTVSPLGNPTSNPVILSLNSKGKLDPTPMIGAINPSGAGREMSAEAGRALHIDVGGTGATAVAAVSGGSVASVAIVGGGYGFTTPPTFTLAGGGGSGAKISVVSLSGGALQAVSVDDGGSGYTSAPTITVEPTGEFGDMWTLVKDSFAADVDPLGTIGIRSAGVWAMAGGLFSGTKPKYEFMGGVVADSGAMGINGIAPTLGNNSAAPTTFFLRGRGFGASQGTSQLMLSTQPASPIPPAGIVSWADHEIAFRLPAGLAAGYYQALLKVGSVTVVSPAITLQPTLGSLSATTATTGTTIAITGGSGFNAGTLANNVIGFRSGDGNLAATTPISGNNGSLTFKVPANAISGPMTLTVGTVAVPTSPDFTVTPSISSVDGALDPVLTTAGEVKIEGTGFCQTPGCSAQGGALLQVDDGAPIAATRWSNSSITFPMPEAIGALGLTLTVSAGNTRRVTLPVYAPWRDGGHSAFDAGFKTLYASRNDANGVQRITPSGGDGTFANYTGAVVNSAFTTSIPGARSIAVGPDGYIYATSGNSVRQLSPSGAITGQWALGGVRGNGLCWSMPIVGGVVTPQLFVSSSGPGGGVFPYLLRATGPGTTTLSPGIPQTAFTGAAGSGAMACDNKGNAYVQLNNAGPRAIWRVPFSGTPAVHFTLPDSAPFNGAVSGLAFDGATFYALYGGKLIKIVPGAFAILSTATSFTPGGGSSNLTLHAAGGTTTLYFGVGEGGTDTVPHIEEDAVAVPALPGIGFATPYF